jgi:hypothetical protein
MRPPDFGAARLLTADCVTLRNALRMSDDVLEGLGLPFLAQRLRRVSDSIIDGVGEVFRTHSIALPPRGGSLLLLLETFSPRPYSSVSEL